ncbi:hypothetical protein EUGRSUZ_C00426 [Eucalyptus grandis]|uniref:Uncharacterized protein n=2 Tax=Eucalyptus grandis TaxID=71139 RepID=A0ACC3L9T4_EUCGR|nr:hypothetical protein EUGRSUZ_C00426 [Eucalyptus grandis]
MNQDDVKGVRHALNLCEQKGLELNPCQEKSQPFLAIRFASRTILTPFQAEEDGRTGTGIWEKKYGSIKITLYIHRQMKLTPTISTDEHCNRTDFNPDNTRGHHHVYRSCQISLIQ